MVYTTAEAIYKLFEVKIGEKKLKFFKDSIATLEGKEVGKGVLKYHEGSSKSGSTNARRYYKESDLSWVHNVIVMQGFFPKPRVIRALLAKKPAMADNLDILIKQIGDRNELGAIHFKIQELTDFFQAYQAIPDFNKEKLPNPFVSLPQLNQVSVVGALTHEASFTLDLMDMLAAYHLQDLKVAKGLAEQLKDHALFSHSEYLQAQVKMVDDKYTEAIELKRVLEILN